MVQPLLTDSLATPVGPLIVVSDPEGRLRAVEWADQDPRLQQALRHQFGAGGYALRRADDPAGLTSAIAAYFTGEVAAIDALPVAEFGTEFQRRVWRALRRIPCGTTMTYGALAARIGRPSAIRAVGAANGANPISVVVPCHRLVGADGSLTGYGGGLARKRWLLAHEGTSPTASRSKGTATQPA